MELDRAIELLNHTVKNNGTNDENHIDFTLVPAAKKSEYARALVVVQLAIQEGKISKDEFRQRVHLT